MKKRIVLILLFFILLLSSGCTNRKVITKTDFALDTVAKITIYEKEDESLLTDSFDKIRAYENKLSAYKADSEISKINANAGIAPVVVADDTFELILESLKFSDLTEGNFDITIGPLIDLWDVHSEQTVIPSDTEIQATKALVGYEKVVMDEKAKSVYLPEKGMNLNLGGIAKGFIADQVKNMLVERGVEHAIINLGGNVVLIGGEDNHKAFNVGIDNPFESGGPTVGVLSLSDCSAVTSGDYQRYFIGEDGKYYHHIINPQTGYPSNSDLHSVTIVSEKSARGDALSTAVFVLGEEIGKKLLTDGIEAVLVKTDGQVLVTDGLKDRFTFNTEDSRFKY